jgi:hypothetical protein
LKKNVSERLASIESFQADVAQSIVDGQNASQAALTINVYIIAIAGGEFMPLSAATVSKNDFKGWIEPAGGNHFINGFFGDAVVFHSLHMRLLKKQKPHRIEIQQGSKQVI